MKLKSVRFHSINTKSFGIYAGMVTNLQLHGLFLYPLILTSHLPKISSYFSEQTQNTVCNESIDFNICNKINQLNSETIKDKECLVWNNQIIKLVNLHIQHVASS